MNSVSSFKLQVCVVFLFASVISSLSSLSVFSQEPWAAKAILPATASARLTAVAFTINNKGYLGTGSVGFGNSVADFWEYNPAGNAWTQKANFGGGARGFACGFSIGSKGYIGTGLNNTTYYNDFWEYDPGTNVWTQKANCGTTLRWCAVAFAVNGKGYIGMGNNQSYVAQQDVWEYDPVANTWTQKANYIGVRCDVDRAAFVIGSKAYCGTGANIGTTPSLNYNDFWQYDPSLNTWTQEANFPGNRRYGATGFSICGEGYLGLGEDSAYAFYSDFYKYDPTANTWTPDAAFNNQRCDAASFVIGSKAYVSCGSFGTSPFVAYKDLWEFTPSGVGTINISATNTLVCTGNSATLTASGGNSYTWNTGNTSSSIVVTPAFSQTFTVADSSSSCAISGSIAVNVVPQPTVTVAGNNSICSGSSATLTANGGGNYSWSNGSTTSSIIVSPTSTSTYSVTTTAGSCADSTSITVNVASPITASIICIDTICAGQSAILSASGGTTYSWNTGLTSSSITISPSASTSYSVFVSSGDCKDSANCSVFVQPAPTANTSADVTIAYGASATLTATGGGNYSWNTGATSNSIVVSPLLTMNYCVVVTNNFNCSDTSCVKVMVEAMDCSSSVNGELFFPSAFYPNSNDDKNKTFGLFYGNYNCIKDYKLAIYNRWGEKVFETTDPTAKWDGSYHNTIDGTAVFCWYLQTTLVSGIAIERKGNVSLMK